MSVSKKKSSLSQKEQKPHSPEVEKLAGQDRRLTAKHIKVLMELDDATLENEKLKSKVDVLEKELSSCLELHELAKSSRSKIETLHNSYQSEIAKIKLHKSEKLKNKEQSLIDKHKKEVDQLQIEMNSSKELWELEKKQLLGRIEELSSEVAFMGDKLEVATISAEKIQAEEERSAEIATRLSQCQADREKLKQDVKFEQEAIEEIKAGAKTC